MYVFLYLPVHNLYIISNGITLYIIYATILVNGKRRPDQKSFLNFFLFLFEWKSLFKLFTEMLMFDHFDMVCFVLFLECGFFCWFLFWTCSDAWSTKQLTLIQMSKLGTSSAVSLSYSQSQRMQTSEGWVIGPTRWKECFPVLCFEFVSSQRPREDHFQLSCQFSFPRCPLQSRSGQSAHGGLHAWEATQANDKGDDSNEKQNCSLELARQSQSLFFVLSVHGWVQCTLGLFLDVCFLFFYKWIVCGTQSECTLPDRECSIRTLKVLFASHPTRFFTQAQGLRMAPLTE